MPTASEIVRPFMSASQFRAVREGCASDEGVFFRRKLEDLAGRISGMPKTYEQDGKQDEAVAYLHYFRGGSDFYITEKDEDGGVDQAFGYAILNGDRESAELGYISIAELTAAGVELDLHFTPTTLGEIKAARPAPPSVRGR